MKKPFCIFFLLFCFLSSAYSQEMGYRTTDVGGEFMNSPKGYTISLQLAFNAAIHNAFLLRAGYNKSNWKDKGLHENEYGNGPGVSLGYRYYFLVRPHGFFLGARLDVWHLKIVWYQGTELGNTKIWALQPAAEMGYMFLINDMFFISPAISAGIQKNIQNTGETVGEGFIPQFGISTGWKF